MFNLTLFPTVDCLQNNYHNYFSYCIHTPLQSDLQLPRSSGECSSPYLNLGLFMICCSQQNPAETASCQFHMEALKDLLSLSFFIHLLHSTVECPRRCGT